MNGCWCPGDLLVGGGFDGGLVRGAGLCVDEANVFGSFGGATLVVAHSSLMRVSVVGFLYWVGGTAAFVHSLTCGCWALGASFAPWVVGSLLVVMFWRMLTLQFSYFILTSVQGMLYMSTIVVMLERSFLSWCIWFFQDSLLPSPLVVLCCVTSCFKHKLSNVMHVWADLAVSVALFRLRFLPC